jgi:hypothetical protein
MTYNRMEAKPMKGEHCRFCGDAKAPLVKSVLPTSLRETRFSTAYSHPY